MSLEQILQALRKRIEFHHKWRLIWSVTYFTGATITVVSAALATATAGFITNTGQGRVLTAGLALAATIFASLEKVLKLREKWDLHRNSQVALEIIELKGFAGAADAKKMVEMIEQVAQSYSLQLSDLNVAPATDGA